MKQKVLAIVPARGDSQGIPSKNIIYCGGKTLLRWTWDAIMESDRITDNILSTDSHEIADHWPGAFVVYEKPINGEAQIEDRLDGHIQAWEPDIIVLLQPTSPLRRGAHIDGAIQVLNDGEFDSVISVVHSHALLWEKHHLNDHDGRLIHAVNFRAEDRPTRQEREQHQFEENGAVYAFTRDCWENHHNRIGTHYSLYVMEEEHRLQVDTLLDLKIADMQLRERELVYR